MLQNQSPVSNWKVMFELEPTELTNFFTYLTEQFSESKRNEIKKEIDNFLNQKVTKIEIEDVCPNKVYLETFERVV